LKFGAEDLFKEIEGEESEPQVIRLEHKNLLLYLLWESVWRFLKLRTELAYDPAVPLLEPYSEEPQVRCPRDVAYPS
jgi:hypothetical protein